MSLKWVRDWTAKQLRIKELTEAWSSERKVMETVAKEFWSCSSQTVHKVKKRMKLDTIQSEMLNRIQSETWVSMDDMWLTWIKVPATDGQPWYSMSFKVPKWGSIDYSERFSELLSKTNKLKWDIPKIKTNDKCLIAIISDIHVWLDGSGQYEYQYWKEELQQSIDKFINSIREKVQLHWSFDKIVLLDLGDWLDWWNWQTTRWWHQLQQNMSNSEQFDTYVEIKLTIIKTLMEMGLCKSLAIRTVTCDNHSWQFSVIANMAIEKICSVIDKNINVASYTQFMHHFVYGENCFIITHGKDDRHQKYWLPLQINDKAINYINNYITVHWLQRYNCHVLKWDLHQCSYQNTKYFWYHNFWSLAVPSGWVQANFWDSQSSYSLLVVDKEWKDIERSDKFIEYKKKLIQTDYL